MYTGSCGNISAPWRQWFRVLLKFFGQPTFTLRTLVTLPNCLFHVAGLAPISRICLCSFSSVKPCHTSFPVGTSESHLNLHLALRTTLTSKSHPKPHCDDPKRVAANVLSAEILRTKALSFRPRPYLPGALDTNTLSSPGVPTFSRAYYSAILSFWDLCCLLAPRPNHGWDMCWSLPVLTLSLVNKSTMRHGTNRVTGSKFYLLGKQRHLILQTPADPTPTYLLPISTDGWVIPG